MYLVIRNYKISPGKVEEVMEVIRDEYVPMVDDVPGFVNYYAMKTEHGFATVGIFCSKLGADESIRLAADLVKRRLSTIIENPPEIITGDVIVQDSAVDEMAVCG